tara:strand:- start:5028 stop:5795 length:768 start_codon:yes stop_codon:yes gene_type:complete
MIRSGFAMLLTLGALVIVVMATSIISRERATDSFEARIHADFLDAMITAESAHDPILAWLETESKDVTVHPNSISPMIRVLNDTFQIDKKRVRITINAWDQFAMIPNGEQIREYEAISGLDQINSPVSVFPSSLHPENLGANIATHNPILGQQTRGNGMPSVNLNTTPAPKLKQLFLQYNISGLDKVLSSRAKSESARGSSIRVDGQTTLRFVSSSQSWSIRTDVQFGLASLSLWSVYVQRGGNWMLEQRIVIPD